MQQFDSAAMQGEPEVRRDYGQHHGEGRNGGNAERDQDGRAGCGAAMQGERRTMILKLRSRRDRGQLLPQVGDINGCAGLGSDVEKAGDRQGVGRRGRTQPRLQQTRGFRLIEEAQLGNSGGLPQQGEAHLDARRRSLCRDLQRQGIVQRAVPRAQITTQQHERKTAKRREITDQRQHRNQQQRGRVAGHGEIEGRPDKGARVHQAGPFSGPVNRPASR